MRFTTLETALVVVLAASVSSSTVDSAALRKCSVNASPSSCPTTEYCLDAKPHSYCTKKLDGRRVCRKDEECRSGVCFVAKERHGKRVCASLPLKDYPLGAQCTQSTQCKSKFCDKGYCTAPVGAGKKCPKEVGCADLDKGAQCLKQAATFVVYSSTGKKQTKKLDAGRCSYISNLGEGMKCSSNANCYGEKFTCSKKTKTCTAIVKPPTTKLPYDETCSTDSQCASGACVSGKCGCKAGGSDCSDTEFCASDSTCQAKRRYTFPCSDDSWCLSGLCLDHDRASRRSPSPFYRMCGCTASDQCPETNACDLSSNKCRATSNFGYNQQCTANAQCASGACVSGKCGCQAESSDCDSSAYCDSTATCQDKLTYGSSCTSSEQCVENVCVSSSTTERSLGRRLVTPPANQICGCSSSDSCNSTAEYCSSQTNLCTAKGAYTDQCSSGSGDQCQSGICLDSNTCGCSSSDDCDASAYCSGDGTCQAKRGYGGLCTSDDQCSTGLPCITPSSRRRGGPGPNKICGCGYSQDACSSSTYCDYPSQQCLAKGSYGQSCPQGQMYQCLSSICFNGSDDTCGCSEDDQCPGEGEVCDRDHATCQSGS